MKKRDIHIFQFMLFIFGIAILPIANSCLADMLDQSFTSGTGDGTLGLPDNAQTFTVGLDGILSRIDVEVKRNWGTLDLVMDVRNTIGGVPIEDDGAVLATTTIPGDSLTMDVATWIEWDVESSGIHVAVGDVLAIVLRVDTTSPASYFWLSSQSGSYSGGQRWMRSSTWNGGALGSSLWNGTYAANETSDMNFRTFIVPVPGAFLLGMLGLSVAGIKLRKQS